MTKREIYLEAARRIAERESSWACAAIDIATGLRHSVERENFCNLFQPCSDEGYEGHDFYNALWLQRPNDKPGEARHRRVIALCLMAAISG